jgi:hypothetical protein
MTKRSGIVAVLPTIRPELVPQFLDGWSRVSGFDQVHWIIVEDNPQKTASVGSSGSVTHVCWEELDLEPDNWIISRRSSAIRSFGFILAHRMRPEVVVTLDDDCLPEDESFLERHLEQLERRVGISWVSSWDELPIHPRGFPYRVRDDAEVVLNHGVWSEVPDLDGITQKQHLELRTAPAKTWKAIPRGAYFPMCGMNLAFKAPVLPLMYFGLQGRNWPYDRFDDIWCGIVLKKVCDHLGWAVTSGVPSLRHTRMSNVDVNIAKEAPGIEFNEVFWRMVEATNLEGCDTAGKCFAKIADSLPQGQYLDRLKAAMKLWIAKF